MELRAALAHEDVARNHLLATGLLQTEPLGLRVAAVAGTAAGFLVCHVEFLVLDARNADIGE
jgi:hypothetical protein